MHKWHDCTKVPIVKFVDWLGIARAKFYEWRRRYGKVNEHNGHAIHAALEEAALRVGAALIAARAPGYPAAYERWLWALGAPPLTDE